MLQTIRQFLLTGLTCILLLSSACYSLKSTSFPPEVDTFYVNLFDNTALNVVPTLNVTFTERLKDKIRLESRLKYNDTDPDIEFSGAIVGYEITSEAPQPDETTAFSRLRITVSVEYTNNRNEEDKWKRSFPFFANFPSDQNIIDIQDDLIETINDQIVEDIFNAAFNNW